MSEEPSEVHPFVSQKVMVSHKVLDTTEEEEGEGIVIWIAADMINSIITDGKDDYYNQWKKGVQFYDHPHQTP
jgi:hypothetical protein